MGNSAKKMRASIIDAAQRIFAKFGFKKTTMDEIAHEIHKEKSSIYHYFRGKEQIYVEVVNKELSALEDELHQALEREASPQGQLRAFIITRIQCLRRLPNLSDVIRDDSRMHLTSLETLRESYRKSQSRMVSDILRFGIEKGVFHDKTFDILLLGVLTAFSGIESHCNADNGEAEFEPVVDNVMELVFHGILKK